MRVRGVQFGVDTVTAVEDHGDDYKVTVSFAAVGTKLLARAGLREFRMQNSLCGEPGDTVTFPSPFAVVAVLTAVTLAACFLSVPPAAAQGSHAYASLGAGATDLSGGVAWLVPNTPVAVGGEFGAGNLFWASLTASYQPVARRPAQSARPFLLMSVTTVGSSPYNATGVSLGGGVVWWARRHVGVRAEALKFWPAFAEDVVPPTPGFPPFEPRLWAVRGGVALRF